VGVDVQAQTYLHQQEGVDDAFDQVSEQTSAGRIVEEEAPTWQSFQVPGGDLPVTVYRARVRVRVAEEKGAPDPDFRVAVTLTRERFRPGEEMTIAVTASKPCFATVLCLTAADTVVVLLPHRYRSARAVAPGDTLRLPDRDEYAMGIRYRVVPPPGRARAVERIKVVATRQEVAFSVGQEQAGVYTQVPTRQAALVELMRWLAPIPRGERAEAQVSYEVVQGE
jgi:hypothetical protein